MTPQQKEQLKTRPKIELDVDGPLIKTRLIIENQLGTNSRRRR